MSGNTLIRAQKTAVLWIKL